MKQDGAGRSGLNWSQKTSIIAKALIAFRCLAVYQALREKALCAL